MRKGKAEVYYFQLRLMLRPRAKEESEGKHEIIPGDTTELWDDDDDRNQVEWK